MEKSLIAGQIELLWAHLHSGEVDLHYVERQARVLADLANFEQLAASFVRPQDRTAQSLPMAA